MSALAYKIPYASPSPRLVLVPPYQAPANPSTLVFWVRRAVALLLLVTVCAGAWTLISAGVDWVSARAVASSAPAGTADVSPVGTSQWTVRPGDTLWSIARAIKPQGDIRPVLEPLIKQYSGQPLQVGQVVTIPPQS